jgi:pilus assembly protein CpaD
MNRIAFRAACLATLALPVALTAGCANKEMTTGSIPMDYRERHPIVLTEAQNALDIPVGPNDARLTIGMKDTIKGFAQTFAASAAGQMQIQMPHGSPNAAAAARLGQDIRATLAASGIRSQRIVLTGYAAQAEGDAAPIRLSFVATRAVTAPCGEWPEDLSNDTAGNRNWYNFGCASQNNLAAQIANPSDLIAPRGVTPIDAARRSTVIGLYRSGGDPSSD